MGHALYRVRLILTPESAGGYVVTSPDLPELVTEGDTASEALENARDALSAVREMYAELGKVFPGSLNIVATESVSFDTLIDAA